MAVYLQICLNEECPMHIFEDKRKMSEIDNEIKCPECETITERTITRPSVINKGRFTYKTGYGMYNSRGHNVGDLKPVTEAMTSSTASKTHKK